MLYYLRNSPSLSAFAIRWLWQRAAVATLILLTAGCAIQTQRGLSLFGDWSLDPTRNADKCSLCGRRFSGSCSTGTYADDGHCSGEQAMPDEASIDETVAQGPPVRPKLRQQGPPPAVHNRFHPVPTRPVFSNPAASGNPKTNSTNGGSRMMESLPREYPSTPRVRSVPHPQLDSDDLQDAKQKASKGDQDEEAPLPRGLLP